MDEEKLIVQQPIDVEYPLSGRGASCEVRPMCIRKESVISPNLSKEDVNDCIVNATKILNSITDRKDLHGRSYAEQFQNIFMGELAEKAVLQYFRENGIYAVSAVDKDSGMPDSGYDIIVFDKHGIERHVSVKSSLSIYKQSPEDIINETRFHLASKVGEICDINVQVYFWLVTRGTETHVSVPSEQNMIIVGWAGSKDITGETASYSSEKREVVAVSLKELRPMEELLKFLAKETDLPNGESVFLIGGRGDIYKHEYVQEV